MRAQGARTEDELRDMANIPLHDPLADSHAGATRETRNTTCYMCACRCGIRVHVRDGQVRYIEGNPDPRFLREVMLVKPHQATLVPDGPQALTSDQGWDTAKYHDFLVDVVAQLQSLCLFRC